MVNQPELLFKIFKGEKKYIFFLFFCQKLKKKIWTSLGIKCRNYTDLVFRFRFWVLFVDIFVDILFFWTCVWTSSFFCGHSCGHLDLFCGRNGICLWTKCVSSLKNVENARIYIANKMKNYQKKHVSKCSQTDAIGHP